MQLTPWQLWRTRAFLVAMGLKRRMTIGTRVILLDGDKVYLIRHTYLPGWQFPGGGVEPGETAEESAAREMLEESGLRATAPLELFGLYHNTNPVTNRDHVVVYICRAFERAFEFKPNREIADFGWFPVGDLPAEATPATQQRIAELFRGEPRRSVWGII